jgi:two-component system response regulator (stage 0 sporulation protein A)
MSITEMKVDAISRMLTSKSAEEYEVAKNELNKLMTAVDPVKASPDMPTKTFDVEGEIMDILREIGTLSHLRGYPYAVHAISLAVEDYTKYIGSITFVLYPTVAAAFDTTASRVERSIRHLIERSFDIGDADVLVKYFGSSYIMKGKVTNAEFIANLANVIRRRMRQ